MFVVLDTNHFAKLVHDTGCGARLKQRFAKHRAEVLTTIITAQEVSEGWSAFIRKQKAGSEKQIHGYAQFQHSLELLMDFTLLPFDEQAAAVFRDLRKTTAAGWHTRPQDRRHWHRTRCHCADS